MHKLPWDFEIQTNHLISPRRPDQIIIDKKKRTCRIVDFAAPADRRVRLKESEIKDKYLDLARELKKLWNMKVTIIPIVIGALGTVTKGLIQGLEDLEWRPSKQLHYWGRPEYWDESWRLEKTFYQTPSSNAGMKNAQGIIIIIIIITIIIMVLQSWIINCLKTYKISDEVMNFNQENPENLESGIESRREKLSWNEGPKRYTSGRCTLTVTIHNCHDATQPHNQKMHGRIQT